MATSKSGPVLTCSGRSAAPLTVCPPLACMTKFASAHDLVHSSRSCRLCGTCACRSVHTLSAREDCLQTYLTQRCAKCRSSRCKYFMQDTGAVHRVRAADHLPGAVDNLAAGRARRLGYRLRQLHGAQPPSPTISEVQVIAVPATHAAVRQHAEGVAGRPWLERKTVQVCGPEVRRLHSRDSGWCMILHRKPH